MQPDLLFTLFTVCTKLASYGAINTKIEITSHDESFVKCLEELFLKTEASWSMQQKKMNREFLPLEWVKPKNTDDYSSHNATYSVSVVCQACSEMRTSKPKPLYNCFPFKIHS